MKLEVASTAKAMHSTSSSEGIVEPRLWNRRVADDLGTRYEIKFCRGVKVSLKREPLRVRLRVDSAGV